MKNIFKHFLFLLLFLGNMVLYAQSCSVNAGGNATICGTSYTLQGGTTGTPVGNPTWTLVSKPAGAPDPVISNINSYTPNVTGMTFPGNDVFQMAQSCSSGSGTSQVTITAPGDASTFTAGPDITNVNATVGTVALNGVVPAGYTASWSAYNIYNFQRFGTKASNNATFGSPASASTSFTLTKKANHNEDPAYLVTLRITSTTNPNCWYEDTAIVRFIPNPQIIVPNTSICAGNGATYMYLSNTSPIFGTDMAGGAGNPSYGTTVTMNVNSQPAGGNIQYAKIMDGILFFTGANVTGAYKFTLTVTNSSGTYTTPEITYTNSGTAPGEPTFIVASDPEQMEYYSTLRTGGEVQCGMAGSTAPIIFRLKLNPADDPAVITITSVSTAGIMPPGGAPSVAMTGGAGTAIRSFTATPPAGGWRVGTYIFHIVLSNGSCNLSVDYYLHISDGSRPNVAVPNTTVCYPGSGVVAATIPLPAVYKQVVNSSYFQDLNGQYTFTLVSKPAGSGTPTAPTTSFTSTSAVIGNLTMPGEYIFKIKAGNSTTGDFIGKEYECSGTSREGTFSVFVSPQINSNAGSDQSITCSTTATLNGNNPGTQGSTGQWTITSKPAGAPNPIITTPSQYNSGVTNLLYSGTYTFTWTITTGSCTSADQVDINVTAAPSSVTATPATQTVAYNAVPTNLTATATGATTYQWYRNTANNNTGGTLIPGATSANYTPPTNIAGTTYYYVVAGNGSCSTPSATVQVTVTPCAASPTAPPVNTFTTTQCPAGTANLNTQAHTGAVPANSTLVWYTDAGRTNMVTSPTAVGAGTYYAFYYNSSSNCYSPASNPVNVLAVVCSACIAPADPMPVNLNSINVAPAPAGSVIQWHNSATPSPATLLASNTVMATSTPANYWVYYYDSANGGCYSPGSKVTVVSNSCCNYPTVDLTVLPQSTVPAGAQLVWYTSSTRAAGTLVSTPYAVGNGIYFPFFYDPVNNCYSPVGTPVIVQIDNQCDTACYKPGITTGTASDTKVGISSLGRAGAMDADNWPMTRKGGHIALESKTKAFVPNRVAFDASGKPVGIAPANFIEGMMVYDITNKCLKIYTSKDNGVSFGWYCITTQACPD